MDDYFAGFTLTVPHYFLSVSTFTSVEGSITAPTALLKLEMLESFYLFSQWPPLF